MIPSQVRLFVVPRSSTSLNVRLPKRDVQHPRAQKTAALYAILRYPRLFSESDRLSRNFGPKMATSGNPSLSAEKYFFPRLLLVQTNGFFSRSPCIIVMGPSESGKNSFISQATNGSCELLPTGRLIKTYPFQPGTSTVPTCLVRFSAFGTQTWYSDVDLLRAIVYWMWSALSASLEIVGVIYFENTHRPVGGATEFNIELFKKLFGSRFMCKAVVCGMTDGTMPDEQTLDRFNRRISDPKALGWVVESEGSFALYNNTRESAMAITSCLMNSGRVPMPRIQQEISSSEFQLHSTWAGSELYKRLNAQLKRCRDDDTWETISEQLKRLGGPDAPVGRGDILGEGRTEFCINPDRSEGE